MNSPEQEVRLLEQTRLEKLAANDFDAVGQLMSEDLVHVHGTGKVEDKTAFLASLRLLPRRTERRSLHVRVFGDVAVLTGEVVNTLTRPGQTAPESIPMMVTQVVRREAGCWRFVSFHASKIAIQPAA
ncbi:MAG: nuclear transport factor 2 family protein [Pseudomonadota bacterium]